VRSVGSVTLQLLRSLEEMLIKGATHNLVVRTRADVALYVLNQKRSHLRELETRFQITITVNADPTISGQQPFVIERGEQVHSIEAAKAIAAQAPAPPVEIDEETEEEEGIEEAPTEMDREGESEGERRPRRRRRRRRGGEDREGAFAPETVAEHAVAHEDHDSAEASESEQPEQPAVLAAPERAGESREEAERRRRRRGRRARSRPPRHRRPARRASSGRRLGAGAWRWILRTADRRRRSCDTGGSPGRRHSWPSWRFS
jgi:ribonuclease E